MQIFGLEIRRSRQKSATMQTVSSRGWFPLIRESFTGAFQQNVTLDQQSILAYSVVWACYTRIAADISKLWLMLVEKDKDGICSETESSAFSPVLATPNHYQTRVKFYEYWMLSKLIYGNTYVLKERDNRGIVTALHVLDPRRVTVLVAPDGSVFYQVGADHLAGVSESEAAVAIPAREIIHDINAPLFHPLVGVSPIFACAATALQGLRILNNSSTLFANGTQLSGVLTAPGAMSNETAERLERHWDTHYAREKGAGKIAAFGDGLKFEPMMMTNVDAQVIEQAKFTAEQIPPCFGVPGYLVGVGDPPPYTNIQSLYLQYYNQALQHHIENLEELLDKGLELPTSPRELHVEFDLAALLRMDSLTQAEVAGKRISAGYYMPNEARADIDKKPVPGGNTPYLQEQNWPLALLAARELPTRPPTEPKPLPPKPGEPPDMTEAQIGAFLRKELGLAA